MGCRESQTAEAHVTDPQQAGLFVVLVLLLIPLTVTLLYDELNKGKRR